MLEIDDYLGSDDVRALAEATQENYKYSLGYLNTFCFTHRVELKDMQDNMKKFARWIKSRDITDQSVRQHLNHVKIFLRWAGHPVEYTYKISNKARQARKLKHSKRWFSQDDIEMCLQWQGARINRLIIRLLIETGCRAQELADVQWKDIDLETRTMYITSSKTEPRAVFFSPVVRKMFKLCIEQDFLLQDNSKPFPSVHQIKTIVTDILSELGLKNGPDGRGPHTFRHYMASHLFFRGGMKIEELAILMGDTVAMVQGTYLHCPEDFLRENTAKAWGWEGIE